LPAKNTSGAREAFSVSNIKNALILAGGQGSRLAPLGEYLPKCLATVYNRPLIDFSLRLLESAAIEDVYIAVSERHHSVVTASIRLLERNIRIHILDERSPAGIRALFAAAQRMPAEPFLFVLGDIYYGAEQMTPVAMAGPCETVLFSHEFEDVARLSSETANLICDGSNLSEIRDKPRIQEIRGFLGWNGMGLVDPKFLDREQMILEWISKNRSTPAIGDLFTAALQLGACIQVLPGPGGEWINVNSPDQLLKAAKIEQQKHKIGNAE